MVFKISMIKTNEIIVPGSAVHCFFVNQYSLLTVIAGSLHVGWRKYSESIHQGDILIGGQFRLHNNSSAMVVISGLTFSETETRHKRFKHPLILKKDHSQSSQVFRDISKLIEGAAGSQGLLLGMEEHLSTIINSVYKSKNQEQSFQVKALTGEVDPRLIMINRHIRENFDQPLTLQTLADLIQCNPVYLSNTYSKVFKISPMRYLQNIRMMKATQWLTQTTDTVGEVAKRLGYISNSQFADLFRRYHGVSPTQYRINYSMKLYKELQADFNLYGSNSPQLAAKLT